MLTSRLNQVEQILFTGNFWQQTMAPSKIDYSYLMNSLNFGVSFHAQSKLKCYFIEQGGYAGVLGALISH